MDNIKNTSCTYTIDDWIITKFPEPLYTIEQIQKFKVLKKVIELNENTQSENATNENVKLFL